MPNDTATMTTTPGSGTTTEAVRPLIRTGMAATALAIAGVTSTYLFSQAVGADLLVSSGDATMEVALAWAFGRWAPRPRMVFLGTTLVGLVAYAAVPFAAAETVTTALWLNAFHLAVAAPLLGLLSRSLPTDRS